MGHGAAFARVVRLSSYISNSGAVTTLWDTTSAATPTTPTIPTETAWRIIYGRSKSHKFHNYSNQNKGLEGLNSEYVSFYLRHHKTAETATSELMESDEPDHKNYNINKLVTSYQKQWLEFTRSETK